MSNSYLKIRVKRKWGTEKNSKRFRESPNNFKSFKVCFQVRFWRAPTHTDIIGF